jgi:putative CocE/NonD family hydrolase
MSIHSGVTVARDIQIETSSGEALSGDLYRPDSGGHLPSVLVRTAYGKGELGHCTSVDVFRLAQNGFNVLVQDVRGRFASEGKFEPYVHESVDGCESIDWLSRQPWSNGAIGMMGRSYSGAVQWLAAGSKQAPATLCAIAPEVSSSNAHEGWTYTGGAFRLAFCLRWVLEDLARPTQLAATGDDSISRELDRLLRNPDLFASPWMALDLLDQVAPYYREWLEHSQYDEYWRNRSAREHLRDVSSPALIIGGWFDDFVQGSLEDFRIVHAEARSARVREQSRLLIGPWSHTLPYEIEPHQSPRPVRSTRSRELTTAHLDWFGTTLRRESSAKPAPVARVFVMGVNEWRDYDAWPPQDVELRELFLLSTGNANTSSGDGKLQWEAPHAFASDAYRYDPASAVPTFAGSEVFDIASGEVAYGQLDQFEIESRQDVLCYTTAELREPVALVGEVSLLLYASSSGPDTDFCAKLVDVGPDGRAALLCDGLVRATNRLTKERATPPRERDILPFRILVGSTANVFLPGHRIRLVVTSSNFPKYDRNINDCGAPNALGSRATTRVRNVIYHGPSTPSRLIVPVLSWE